MGGAIGNDKGKGGDVMGHPLNARAWLAGKLAAVGTPLRRGMIVMTYHFGPITIALAAARNDRRHQVGDSGFRCPVMGMRHAPERNEQLACQRDDHCLAHAGRRGAS